jgi:hypothetical protein
VKAACFLLSNNLAHALDGELEKEQCRTTCVGGWVGEWVA